MAANVVSFQKRIPPGAASRGTLAELMAKQKDLAERQAEFGGVKPIESWTQGLSNVAGSLVTGLQYSGARAQEQEGRERLAQIRANINPETGITAEQESEAYLIDPDLADKFRDEALTLRKEKRDRDLAILDRDEQRIYNDAREGRIDQRELEQSIAALKEQRSYTEGVTTETRAYEEGQETAINTREEEEEAARNQRELGETIDADKRAAAADRVKLAAETAAGQTRIVTGAEAEARGGDPTRQYKISADGTKLEDVTPDVPEQYRTLTREEVLATPNLDPNLPYRINLSTNKVEAIGTPPQDQPVASEVAGRVGLMDDYLKQYTKLSTDVKAGALSGTNFIAAKAGKPGRGTDILREIQTGAEALIRNLTGAGMPLQEAEKYVLRYEPTVWSLLGPEEAVSKMNELYEDMWNVREAVLAGRKWHDDPSVFRLHPEEKPATEPAPAATDGGAPAPALPGTGKKPVPAVGTVVNGLTFMGGNPNVRENWVKK